MKGKTSWNKGRTTPLKVREKIRASRMGQRWKGGRKLAIGRHSAKRRTYGFEPINEEFEGSEGHHIDRFHIIFIPKELHRSVWHALKYPETMERINTKVICWLLGVD
jgi:hypothetical protein